MSTRPPVNAGPPSQTTGARWGRRGVALALLALASLGAVAGHRARLADPAPTVLVRSSAGRFLDEIGTPEVEGVGYWPVDPVPPRIAAATLALEDRRFASHPGVDPLAVARAIRQDLAAGEVVSGASTLAMQLARMQDPGARTLPNKALEATTALLLTARYGRDAVLAQYLRYAPYGNGIHGIAYAARRYLDKPVADLSWAETAFLCALPQAPSRTNPFRPEGRARAVTRAHRIVTVLADQQLLTPEERALADADLDGLRFPDKGRRPEEALHAVLQMREQLSDPATRAALGPAPIVTATLDPDLQGRIASLVNTRVLDWERRGAGNAAVLVVDVVTGDVVAHVGSTDYFGVDHAGAIDYSRVRRPAGSTLKPFLYAAALDQGAITPATLLDDRPHSPGGIANADGAALGPLLPRQALGNSRNVPAIEVLARFGPQAAFGLYRSLGLVPEGADPGDSGEGLAIGVVPVTLQGLVAAATVLAGDGHLRPLRWWHTGDAGGAARTADGPPPADAPPPAEGAALADPSAALLQPDTARLVTRWLADPMARLPTFPRLGNTELPFPVAVKTGTSPDFRDAWTIAWTPRYLVGAWVGDPRNTPMAHLSGYVAAADLARAVLVDLAGADADGLADRSFPAPRDLVPARICAHSGLLAGPRCALAFPEAFPPASVPTTPCPGEAPPPPSAGPSAAARPPASPIAASDAAPLVRILSPPDGAWLLRDPDVPADHASIALEASVDPPSAQITWYVDGEPLAVADAPYTTRWVIQPGYHRIEARIPYTSYAAKPVRVLGR